MTAGHPLDHVLRHNTWANVTLLEFCRRLDPALLEANANGTYGTLYGTLQHVVGAEQWYVQLLTGELLGRARIRRNERHSLDELLATATAIGARELEVVASDDVTRRIEMNEGRRSTVGVILAQLVHHGNEHRTQVTTILGANGIEPPPVSAWGYGRAAGISEAEE
ncbi:MAG: hypothetical protein M3P16_01880 [Chloroflexota bacterium]|nr:hypothetical protein [Chloroflexota bacterium]